MSKIQTVNNLIKVFKDIATRHYQIEYFYVGNDWEIGTVESMHPVLWINPVEATMPAGDNGYKTFQVLFEVKVFDLVNKDESNENDVLSDTIDILKDIIMEFKGHPYYTNSQLDIIDDIDFESFTEKFDEEVSGWLCEINMKTPLLNSFCGIPAADITGYEFSDTECNDFNVLCPISDTFVETSILNGSDLELTRNDGVVLTTDLSSLGGSITTGDGLNISTGGDIQLGGSVDDGDVVLTFDTSSFILLDAETIGFFGNQSSAFICDVREVSLSGNYNGSNSSVSINEGVILTSDSYVNITTPSSTIEVDDFIVNIGNISRITDSSSTPKGIQYNADYSSTFVNRSLVDKEYVDTAISSSGFSGTFTNGDGDTVTVTNGIITNIN